MWASICCLSTRRCAFASVVCVHLFTMRSGTHGTLPCTCTCPSPQWHMIFGRKTGVALPCRRLEFTSLQTAWVVQSGPWSFVASVSRPELGLTSPGAVVQPGALHDCQEKKNVIRFCARAPLSHANVPPTQRTRSPKLGCCDCRRKTIAFESSVSHSTLGSNSSPPSKGQRLGEKKHLVGVVVI